MIKYCPICNRSSKDAKFYGEFCQYCESDKMQQKIAGSVEITECKRCGKIRIGPRFMAKSDNSLTEALAKHFKGQRFNVLEIMPNGFGRVEVFFDTPDGDIRVEKTIKVNTNRQLCQECYKRSSGYFEAVIQLRGNKIRAEKMIEKIKRYFEAKGEFISKVEDKDGGKDVYVSSKNISNLFMSERELHPEKSFTLYGVKKGRKVYRNTYALHL